MSDYNELLDRAIEQLPTQARETKRFSVPKAYSIIQGNRTIIQNFGEIADAMNRDPHHILKFLLKGTGYCWKPGRKPSHNAGKIHPLPD